MIYLLMGVFFILSFVMARINLKIPTRHQMYWWVSAVWGITFVVSAVFGLAAFYPIDLLTLYWHLWGVFLSALPGQIYLNWEQAKRWQGEVTRREKANMALSETVRIQTEAIEMRNQRIRELDAKVKSLEAYEYAQTLVKKTRRILETEIAEN